MNKVKIKKNDYVLVIAGKERGKTGRVVEIGKKGAIVEGLNIYKKHAKPSGKYPQGGIIDLAKPISISNLMVICQSCKKPTRVKIKRVSDGAIRICKKCNEVVNVS